MLWVKSVSNKNYSSVLFVINSKLDNERYCTNLSYHNKRVKYMGIYILPNLILRNPTTEKFDQRANPCLSKYKM